MANHNVNNPTFNPELRMYEVTDRGHANTFNANEDVLIKNDVYLKNQIDTIKQNNTTSNSDLNTHKNNTNIHVTTVEKQTWNNKASTNLATTTQNGLMSAADKQTINDLSTTINNSVTGQKVLTEIKKVDGTGSGLDADLLDGKEASAFSLTSHSHSDATESQAGFMSAIDKQAINKIPTNIVNGEGRGSIQTPLCTAKGLYSIALGAESETTNEGAVYSHAEGLGNTISSSSSYAFGDWNKVSGKHSYASGWENEVSEEYSHAEGHKNEVSGNYSHAEGEENIVSATHSHAEGYKNEVSGDHNYSFGTGNKILNSSYSAAIGRNNTVSTYMDHAFAIGAGNTASGSYSIAAGYQTETTAQYTIALNYVTVANIPYSTAIGRGNMPMKEGDIFVIGNGRTIPFIRSNIFRVSESAIYGTGAYNTSGADYAEYFEWLDQNPDNEDRVGLFVTLDGEKIRIANSKDDYILGVVSGSPSIIGNSYNDKWQEMHIKDDFGRVIYEDVEVPANYETIHHEAEYKSVEDKDTGETKQELVKEAYDEKVLLEEAHTERCPKLNPDYNSDQEFIGREKRKEWDCIGMLGVLNVYDDGTCKVNSYCKATDNGIATSSDTGYRVLKRVNDNIIKILFR